MSSMEMTETQTLAAVAGKRDYFTFVYLKHIKRIPINTYETNKYISEILR